VFRKADALSLPYPDSTFDIAMSFGLLEHFSDIESPIREQMRVLKPGGIFFADIVTGRFSVDTFSRIPQIAGKMVRAVMGGKFSELRDAGKAEFFENAYPLDQYTAAVERCGGRIRFARGNRPFTRFGKIPLIAPLMLRLYKTRACQRIWKNFDVSGSSFARFWGAGWWVLAEKEA
jgi:SAM-dependent methyltransferase